jgi:hypothetical protein
MSFAAFYVAKGQGKCQDAKLEDLQAMLADARVLTFYVTGGNNQRIAWQAASSGKWREYVGRWPSITPLSTWCPALTDLVHGQVYGEQFRAIDIDPGTGGILWAFERGGRT